VLGTGKGYWAQKFAMTLDEVIHYPVLFDVVNWMFQWLFLFMRKQSGRFRALVETQTHDLQLSQPDQRFPGGSFTPC
jgi:hypothetical protein